MSKVSFRARALDSNKPLPVYTEDELPDLAEYVAINRTVPQMPTGMEKEEESERHLQRVINARQNFNESGKAVVIPIPEATIPVLHYSSVYQTSPAVPFHYIRIPGLGLREDIPDYDLDSEDEEWLNAQSKERPLSPTHFERMMDKLEKGSGNTVLSEHDAQVLLKDEQDLVMAVYDYWLAKRLRLGRSLIPAVRNERRDGTSSSNPYLAFRKRTEKMQTRKNRKNDEQAYTHMLKLRRDLSKAMKLVELLRDREIKKNELDHCYADIFQKRYQLEDWSGSVLSSLRPVATPNSGGRHLSVADGHWDSRGLSLKVDGLDDNRAIGSKKKKKKKLFPLMIDAESPLTPSLPHDKAQKEAVKELDERNELSEADGMFTFKRKVHVHYHGIQDWTSRFGIGSDYEGPVSKKFCFSLASFGGRKPDYFRRRVGRGGRTIWDRMSHDRHNELKQSSVRTESSTDTANLINGSAPLRADDFSEATSSKCACFCPVSPAPNSTNFSFSYLPFIDPSTYYCPDLNKGYNKFGGLQSDSETRDEVLSFSALPTSLFALKPSSCEANTVAASSATERSTSQSNDSDRSSAVAPAADAVTTDQKEPSQDNKLPVPPTHLSMVEVGLPVQIHVGNLKHLPKKDVPTPNPSDDPSPLPLLSPSLPLPTTNTSSTGVQPSLSNEKSPSPMDWLACHSSSSIATLDKPTKRAGRLSRRSAVSCVSSQTVAAITGQLKAPVVKMEPSLLAVPVLSPVPAVSLAPTTGVVPLSFPSVVNRTASLPSSSLSSLPLQSKLVSSLMLDQRTVETAAIVRDKAASVSAVHHNNQNNSPNGSVHDLFHAKLQQTEADKDIKHAAIAGAVVNHNNSLVDGTVNSLVKLNTHSQVT